MLLDEANKAGEPVWAAAVETAPDWREVDRRLRGIARRRGALDREEIVALRDAMRVQVWREVGYASMREYLERVFGYGPRAASDRLRVAAALDAMPVLENALDAGELPYSAVREIARVATSRTADAWVEACRGTCLRDIEELVAQHTAGDRPDSPPREHERPQLLRLELGGSEYALWRQARQILEGERDEAVSDRELLAAVCTALIERARDVADRVHVGRDPAPTDHVDDEPTSTNRVDELTPTDRIDDPVPADRAHVGSGACSADRLHVCVESAATGHVDGARPTDRAHDTLDRAHVGSGACSADRLHVCIESAATDNIDDARALTDRAIGTLDHAQVGAPDPIEVDRGSARAKGGTRRLGSDAQRGRAKYQIAVVVCETCRRGWQEGGGKRIPITVEDVARAECDAQWVGSLDGEPGSAAQDIAPKTRRFVWHRDGGRCTVPGCRASSFLEVHHIVHREHGGGNEAENLTLLCGGHHDAHHAGRLVIRGRAPNLRFELAGERLKPTRAHVDALPERAEMRADAVLALHTLGFKKPEAVAAVDAALAARSPPSDLETLLRLALRYCPR